MSAVNVSYKMITISAVFLSALAPFAAQAEVTSRPCPHSCKTEGIDRSQCKDWREGNTCFVDDLRKSNSANPSSRSLDDESGLTRKITTVQKIIPAGEEYEVDLYNDKITRIDVVARREAGGTQTKLELKLEDGTLLGEGAQQVDKNTNHVLRWLTGRIEPDGRELELHAMNGSVFIESVHVFYDQR